MLITQWSSSALNQAAPACMAWPVKTEPSASGKASMWTPVSCRALPASAHSSQVVGTSAPAASKRSGR
ncbi:hypothetical protein CNMCM6805_010018 [Aspergillus fumigatiaffinis]|uniref:Uncharacterized protein n=1 Tax=Aspergillus fumigatiaffinis TaxID=340414 RepID=A0A8H4LZ19_9EURO|nr:hypothetical protein CNMCM6805_010018 [Aspergillus fumigatiaffinis]